MLRSERDKYVEFWKEFGRVMKEGPSFDFDNKDKLVTLCLFESSADPDKLTTLSEYVALMKPDQTSIYYITGPSRRAVENSPHLEGFKEKGYQVLYLVDPVDEMLMQLLPEYDGKKLKSIAKGAADLGEQQDSEKQKEFSKLTDALQQKLDDRVKEVRLSTRLTSSPACLVVSEHDVSPNLEKLMNQAKGASTKQKRIMELNANHEIIARMRDRADDAILNEVAEVLYGYALLAEGSELEDPLKFNQAVIKVLAKTV